jgi:hypothetical protein
MSGTHGGVGRIVAMVVALAIGLVLLMTGEARAARYAVAQCGWYVGIDADWADTTGATKFRPDAFCVPGPPADPFDGSHLKSFTTYDYATVSGENFSRWRWLAPPGTYITQLRGTWWHALHDGFEQRIGAINWAGGFEPVMAASSTDVTPRDFVLGFPVPIAGIEDRLLCARGGNSWCILGEQSWTGLRALTITLEDEKLPGGGIGGDLTAPGWLRGTKTASIEGNDVGSGVRFGETLIDGVRAALTEYPCAIVQVGGTLEGRQMRPCLPLVSESQSIATTTFSDGPHSLSHCVTDFSGNRACTPPQTIYVDNNPPAHPRPVTIAGGEGWHRVDDFDLTWTDPDQGAASQIVGANWRITGQAGYDSGIRFAPGNGIAALSDLRVPGAGEYTLRLWLRDEAGNESAATAIELPLRFDDAAPSVAFAPGQDDTAPDQIRAAVTDPLAGPAGGTISYRRAENPNWTELPTKLAGEGVAKGTLVAPVPELNPGTYLFQAEALDGAGNRATTTLRADGTRMAIYKGAKDGGAGGKGGDGKGGDGGRGSDGQGAGGKGDRAKIRLFARLLDGRGKPGAKGGNGQRGRLVSGKDGSLTVPFGTPATVAGRLTSRAGAGLAGRRVRVVARPSRGALAPAVRETVTTGRRGGFELALAPGTSRRVDVYFAGGDALAPARRTGLDLRVRSGIALSAARTELRTGQEVHLRGRVRDRGAPIPRRGKLVAIQYLEAATHRWRPVLVVHSDHGGRFHARYRFRYVSGTARIRLRATALAEERWPYAPGSSRPVTVEVHG